MSNSAALERSALFMDLAGKGLVYSVNFTLDIPSVRLGRYEDRAPSKFSTIATPKSQSGEDDEDEDDEAWPSHLARVLLN